MSIDLNSILNKELESKQGADIFTFDAVGDQIVFRFLARRTVKTARGEESDLIEADVLGGRKLDKLTKQAVPVIQGARVFFLSTVARRIFDAERPVLGDIIHLSLTETRPEKNNMKLYGFEFVEKVSRDAPKAVSDGDDLPF
jgi:hypothetical protein